MESFPLPPTFGESVRKGLISQLPHQVARELRRADRLAAMARYLDDQVPSFYVPTNDDLACLVAERRLAHTDTLSLMDAI